MRQRHVGRGTHARRHGGRIGRGSGATGPCTGKRQRISLEALEWKVFSLSDRDRRENLAQTAAVMRKERKI